MTKKADPQHDAAQYTRFLETARALRCDEDEAAFDEKLKVIARHKPKSNPKLPVPDDATE